MMSEDEFCAKQAEFFLSEMQFDNTPTEIHTRKSVTFAQEYEWIKLIKDLDLKFD